MADRNDGVKKDAAGGGGKNSTLLAWAGGVLDAGLTARIDRSALAGTISGISKKNGAPIVRFNNAYSLRIRITSRNKAVLKAWAKVMNVPYVLQDGGLRIPAKEHLRILQTLKRYSVREDLAYMINFRMLRRRGEDEFKATKEITEAIKKEERNDDGGDEGRL